MSLRLFLCFALCGLLLLIGREPQAGDGQGEILVTVTGKIGKTNRGPSDTFLDAFFTYHDVSFEKAYAFDRADLASLGMEEITLRYPNWPEPPMALRGPMLKDILHKVAAEGRRVTVQALDGYAIEFDIEELRREGFLLAIEDASGPLSIGGRGPAWLVREPGEPDTKDERLVWSVFHLQVE